MFDLINCLIDSESNYSTWLQDFFNGYEISDVHRILDNHVCDRRFNCAGTATGNYDGSNCLNPLMVAHSATYPSGQPLYDQGIVTDNVGTLVDEYPLEGTSGYIEPYNSNGSAIGDGTGIVENESGVRTVADNRVMLLCNQELYP